nr:LuxR C-terminal-related transcriptional regulator [Pseudomonas sp. Irchel s3h14]
MSNKQIGRELGISDGTVKIYVRNLLQKLSLRSRLELATWVHNGASVRHEERH